MEHRSGFGRFHQSRFVVNLIVAAEFHKRMAAIQHFIFNHALVCNDGFSGLFRRGSGVHNGMLVRGLIADGRRQLHDLIHAGPEFFCGDRGILSRCFQAIDHNGTFGKENVALPVRGILACQHLEHRAGQLYSS